MPSQPSVGPNVCPQLCVCVCVCGWVGGWVSNNHPGHLRADSHLSQCKRCVCVCVCVCLCVCVCVRAHALTVDGKNISVSHCCLWNLPLSPIWLPFLCSCYFLLLPLSCSSHPGNEIIYTEWLYWSTAPTSFSTPVHYVHGNWHRIIAILCNSQIWSGEEVQLASALVWMCVSWVDKIRPYL